MQNYLFSILTNLWNKLTFALKVTTAIVTVFLSAYLYDLAAGGDLIGMTPFNWLLGVWLTAMLLMLVFVDGLDRELAWTIVMALCTPIILRSASLVTGYEFLYEARYLPFAFALILYLFYTLTKRTLGEGQVAETEDYDLDQGLQLLRRTP